MGYEFSVVNRVSVLSSAGDINFSGYDAIFFILKKRNENI